MAIEDLIEQIKAMKEPPYNGNPITSVDKDEEENTITVAFKRNTNMRRNIFHLCDSVTWVFRETELWFNFSDDSKGIEGDIYLRCPEKLYLGVRKAVYSMEVTGDNTALLKIYNKNIHLVAGYRPEKLMKAIYACIEKVKNEHPA